MSREEQPRPALSRRYLILRRFRDDSPRIERSDAMRSATLARSVELLKIAGRPSGLALISGLGARGALALGILLPSVLILHPASTTPFTIACAAFALSAGIFFTKYPTVLPLPLLDSLLVIADALLALLGIYDDAVVPVLPGTYVVIGTIVFAVRRWPIAVTHGALLGLSYGSVLVFSSTTSDRLVRWVSVLTAITVAGLFIRWLVEQVLGIAARESASRAAAEKATQELTQLSEMRSAFLARMSHELRTPLNAVVGFSDLLAEQLVGPLNDRQLEYTQDISAAARHQVELVDEVLDLSKVESGLHELAVESLDLVVVLDEAVRLVRETAERKGLRLELTVDADLGLVVVDRLRIRQVIVNLLGNAVKFTPSGGQIEVHAVLHDGGVRISVRDTGVGMTADDLAIAFEEYARADARAEGTGLGLPLARRFVELHGGTLTATSTPGAGSVFVVDLPRQPTLSNESAARAAQPGRVERGAYIAFIRPGSAANRKLLSAIVARYTAAAGLLFAVLAAVSTLDWSTRALLAGSAVGCAVASPLVHSWLPAAGRRQFEALAWVGIGVITALVYFAGAYTSITALAYGCVITTSFALWSRVSAVLQLIGIAGAYAVVLAIDSPPAATLQWLTVVVLLGFQAHIVNWIAERLRRLVIAEHTANATAEQVLAELNAVSRHKSAFLANMSHELRTPLNAIIGFAELLDTELVGELNERQREFVADIRLAARHLLSLITLALDVARLEAGRMPLNLDVVVVRALLERAVDTARSALDGEQTCAVEVAVQPGADYVVADPHLLQQAVAQLVGNALRFSPQAATVTVVAAPAADNNLEIDVHDSGTGVAEQHHEMIFEPFHQVAFFAGSTPHGAGLGLPLVRGVADLHGGRVWFTSGNSEGSTFSLILPRLVSSADALASAVEATA